MDQYLHSQLELALQAARDIWGNVDKQLPSIEHSKDSILKILKHPSIRLKVIVLYDSILRSTRWIRSTRRKGPKLAAYPGTVEDTGMALLDMLPPYLVLMNSSPDGVQLAFAMDFLAFARSNYAKRLKTLEYIQTESDLRVDLGLSADFLEEKIYEEKQSLTYYRKIRAGSRKASKLFCIYPIHIILKLNGSTESQRMNFMHELMVYSKASDFGNKYSDSYRGEREELATIREWDRESIKWYQSL
ncbi:MAG: hypothetical protein KAU50_01295 [Candidatus Marinimicrobia bacterium]|nr:hypothetical protein [Candidatus Neomarinimicrobiota bacterium]